MARFPSGANLMQQLTLTIDMSKVEREAFGRWGWRRRLATWLLGLAARVMRTGIAISGADNE